jgi:hypothetical protein
VIVLLAALVALADEPPPVAASPTPSLRVRRQGRRAYPRPIYDDLTVTRRCTVEVTIDDEGRPTSVRPVDCPPELEDWTRRRVLHDRWETPVPPGAVARVEVVYVPPADVTRLPAPDYWRRRSHGACELRIEVDAAGHVRLNPNQVDVDPACVPALVDVAPLPPTVFGRKSPTICPITFVLVDGAPTSPDLFRCEVPIWATARDLLARWTWPVFDAPQPYTVQLELIDGRFDVPSSDPGSQDR